MLKDSAQLTVEAQVVVLTEYLHKETERVLSRQPRRISQIPLHVFEKLFPTCLGNVFASYFRLATLVENIIQMAQSALRLGRALIYEA